MPRFMGTLEAGVSEQVAKSQDITRETGDFDLKSGQKNGEGGEPYIVLENLLHGFDNPSIIDIKLGSVLTDSKAAEEKKTRLAQVSESTTSGSHSFRVCGMKLFGDELPDLRKFPHVAGKVVQDEGGYIRFDKWYGRDLNSDTLDENFKIFFRHNKLSSERQQIVIRNTFTRLQILYNCLLEQEIRMVSSSLLIVYENNLDRWAKLEDDDPIYRDDTVYEDEDEDEDEEIPASAPLSLVSLIDFAHTEATPGRGYDENTIKGVENLLDLFEKLLEE
jgi:1D-myo-inositol-tetrakisphosphate 5-kinase/inositol-polyphosphate multikinase